MHQGKSVTTQNPLCIWDLTNIYICVNYAYKDSSHVMHCWEFWSHFIKVNHSLCQLANWAILGKNKLQQREHGYSEPKVIVNNISIMHRKRRVLWFAQYSCCDAVSNVNYRAPAWNGDGTRWRWCHDKNGMLKWTSRLRPAGHTRNRESLSSWWSHLKNDNQTQQQNRKQIEALLFDALQSLLRVTSCYKLNNARAWTRQFRAIITTNVITMPWCEVQKCFKSNNRTKTSFNFN